MVSTFTNGKMHLEKPAAGDYVDAWAPPINANFDAADAAVSNTTLVTITSADVTLTLPQARVAYINCSGALSATRQLIFPNTAGGLAGGAWVINNGCSGAFTLTAIVSGGAGIVIPQGHKVLVISDGTNMVQGNDWIAGAVQQVTATPNGSLTGEAGTVQDPITSMRFDNVARRLYAALGGTSWIAIAAALPLLAADITDANITNPKLVAPRMTAQYLTGVGAAQTYNRPADCHTIIVIEVGSGAGGGAAGNAQTGADGGDTTFNSIVAKGGLGGLGGGGTLGYGGDGGSGGAGAALFRIKGAAGQYGFPNNDGFQYGGNGGVGLFGAGSGRGGRNNEAGQAAVSGSGAGGGGGSGAQNASLAGGGGGAGELVFFVIQNPAAIYLFTITNGGAGGTPGTQAGGTGAPGSILVLEFY